MRMGFTTKTKRDIVAFKESVDGMIRKDDNKNGLGESDEIEESDN